MQIKILQTGRIKEVDEIIKENDTITGYRSGCVIYRPELVEVIEEVKEEKPKKAKNVAIS